MKSKGILILFATILLVPFAVVGRAQQPSTATPKKANAPQKPKIESKNAAVENTQGTAQMDKALLARLRSAAGRVLERDPNLKPKPLDAFKSDRDFIEAAQPYARGARLNTVDDAVRALEKWFAGEADVTANVSSTPGGLPIRYRPVATNDPYLDTTTDNPALAVKPVTYFFIATDSNGKEQTQRIACVRGCTVVFNPPF